MDRVDAVKILTFLTIVHVTNCQTIGSVSGPPRAASGTSVSLTCTVNGASNQIQWIDTTDGATVIYTDAQRFSRDSKYLNFNITSISTTASEMTIHNAEVEDDGTYQCVIPTDTTGQDASLVIEAPGTLTLTVDSIVTGNMDMYQATCDADGGKPQETITWTLNGVTQTDGNGNTIVETNRSATPPLSNTRSVFTFPATVENHGQMLVCETTGHTLTELNGQESRNLDIHSSPDEAGTTVTVVYVTQGTGIRVTCDAADEPIPKMRNYYIYSNGMEIHESTDGDNQVTVQDPVVGTNYTCLASNYLGNTSSKAVPYVPIRPTTPSTTTESSTAEGTTTERPAGTPTSPPPSTTDGEDTTGGPSGDGPSAAAIGGGVAGAIVFIIIIVIVIIYFKKRGKDGPSGASSTKKHGSSTVGTSNGSEKNDVELAAPLNHGVNEVLTEDKIKPVAAPRDQGSIQHTTDNPGQAEYAMVDRKKPGGDMPDTRGPGQKEPQGMLYADLDLSASAGHTEKKVPQNKDDVVVYSSILV